MHIKGLLHVLCVVIRQAGEDVVVPAEEERGGQDEVRDEEEEAGGDEAGGVKHFKGVRSPV